MRATVESGSRSTIQQPAPTKRIGTNISEVRADVFGSSSVAANAAKNAVGKAHTLEPLGPALFRVAALQATELAEVHQCLQHTHFAVEATVLGEVTAATRR